MELGKSNIRKFMICHSSEYVPGDSSCLKELPLTPNLPLKGSSNYVSAYAHRGLRGEFIEILRAEQKVLSIEATCIGENNIDNVNSMIMDKILQYGNRDFYMNLYHPSIGWYFTRVYIGTPIESETVYLDPVDGSKTITNLKFNVIETDGNTMNI